MPLAMCASSLSEITHALIGARRVAACEPPLGAHGGLVSIAFERSRAITDARDFREQLTEIRALRQPAQLRTVARKADVDFAHRGVPTHLTFDQPCTSCASDPFDGQRGALSFVRLILYEVLLDRQLVVGAKLRQRFGFEGFGDGPFIDMAPRSRLRGGFLVLGAIGGLPASWWVMRRMNRADKER